MDQNKLRTLVFEKTGIKIDTTDPVFAVVALNEAVLSEYVDRHIAVMNELADKMSMQTSQLLEASERYRKLLQHIGDDALTENVPDVAALLKTENNPTLDKQVNLPANPIDWRWISSACGIALLTATLTIAGQWAFGRNEKPPTSTAQATQVTPSALTPDQILLIQNGEKFARMWPKLDAKTQARIQGLLQAGSQSK